MTPVQLPIELGIPGHKRTFDPAKLEGEYSTTYKYTLKDAESDRIRLAMADAASKYFDPETVLEKVLEVDDPKGVMRKRYYYMAEAVSPNVRNFNIITSLLELADEVDKKASRAAQIMAEELRLSIANIRAGKMAPERPIPATVPETSPEELLPSRRMGSLKAAQESLIEKSAPKIGGQ